MKKEFVSALSDAILPGRCFDKRNFRQLISHNIRYKEQELTRTLGSNSKAIERESLFLCFLGCSFPDGEVKNQLEEKLVQAQHAFDRLANGKSRSDYQVLLDFVNRRIVAGDEQNRQVNAEASQNLVDKERYEVILFQLDEMTLKIKQLHKEIEEVSKSCYSQENQDTLRNHVARFNHVFSDLSHVLYGEDYLLNFQLLENKNHCFHYDFFVISNNNSYGREQAIALCFDIACMLFADQEGCDCLHFLLRDKKGLMLGKQQGTVATSIKGKNVQVVVV